MPDTKTDIAELRERATGGGSFMACRHPDIDHGARRSDLQDRQCVLDYGAPEGCDQSAPPHGTVTDKTACPYWALLPHAEPAGASAEELLSLLDQLEQSQRDRDEALDRIEELERDAEIVSAEFEKECWQAVRSLLEKVGWTDFIDGVSADLACEIIYDAIASSNKRAESLQSRVAELTAEVEDAREYIDGVETQLRDANTLVARLRGAGVRAALQLELEAKNISPSGHAHPAPFMNGVAARLSQTLQEGE